MFRSINQNSQHGEELGAALNLIDDYKASQIFQSECGLIESGEIIRIFQIKSGDGSFKSVGKPVSLS